MMELDSGYILFGIIGLLILVLVGKEARDIWAALDENKMRVYILDRYNFFHRYYPKKQIEGKIEFVIIKGISYEVKTDYVYRMGRFRVPTSFYKQGDKRPLRQTHLTTDKDEHDGADFTTVQKARFVTQLIRAFLDDKVSPEMALIIILGVVAAANGALYYFITQRLDELMLRVGG